MLDRLKRSIYLVLGFAFVGLAVLGVFLPLLPTTPFLLLASAMFVRSSPRLNRWLLETRLLGPFLRDWQRLRGVRRSVKITAVIMILAVGGTSLVLADLPWPLMLLVAVILGTGLIVVLRLKTIADEPEPGESAAGPLTSAEKL